MTGPLARGRDAYSRGECDAAYSALAEAAAEAPLDTDDLALFAEAAWLSGKAKESLTATEAVYTTRLRAGEHERAATAALEAALVWANRDEITLASGWLNRARRGLDGLDVPAAGYLAYLDAVLALDVGEIEPAVRTAPLLAEDAVRLDAPVLASSDRYSVDWPTSVAAARWPVSATRRGDAAHPRRSGAAAVGGRRLLHRHPQLLPTRRHRAHARLDRRRAAPVRVPHCGNRQWLPGRRSPTPPPPPVRDPPIQLRHHRLPDLGQRADACGIQPVEDQRPHRLDMVRCRGHDHLETRVRQDRPCPRSPRRPRGAPSRGVPSCHHVRQPRQRRVRVGGQRAQFQPAIRRLRQTDST